MVHQPATETPDGRKFRQPSGSQIPILPGRVQLLSVRPCNASPNRWVCRWAVRTERLPIRGHQVLARQAPTEPGGSLGRMTVPAHVQCRKAAPRILGQVKLLQLAFLVRCRGNVAATTHPQPLETLVIQFRETARRRDRRRNQDFRQIPPTVPVPGTRHPAAGPNQHLVRKPANRRSRRVRCRLYSTG